MDKSESLDKESDDSCFLNFQLFLLLSRPLLLDFLYLLSLEESDLLDDESENDGSDSGYSGTCAFPLSFDESVGRVSGLESGVFLQ